MSKRHFKKLIRQDLPAYLPKPYFGKSRAFWLEGRNERSPISLRQAERKQAKLAATLKRQAKQFPDQKNAIAKLADLLNNPNASHLIRSGASVIGRRAFQRWCVESGKQCLSSIDEPLVCISFIPPWSRPFGKLTGTCPYTKLRNHLRRAFKEAGVTFVIGWFDISENEHRDAEWEPHYRVHFWGIMALSEVRAVRDILKKYFPVTSKVPKPIRIQKYDGDLRAIAYGTKVKPHRRVTTAQEVDDNNKVIKRQNTRKRDMRKRQLAEFMLMSHKAGLAAPLFLYGASLWLSPDGMPIIKRHRKKTASPKRIQKMLKEFHSQYR